MKQVNEDRGYCYPKIEKYEAGQRSESVQLPGNRRNVKQVNEGWGIVTRELKKCETSQESSGNRYPRIGKI